MPENTPEFAQICVDDIQRCCGGRLGLQARTGFDTFCTNRVFSFFQLTILFASCSCAPCISATSSPCRKIPPNLRKFALTALNAVVQGTLVCSSVQVWAPFVPPDSFHISTRHPLSFMFMCTLHYCNITMPESAPECAQICFYDIIR